MNPTSRGANVPTGPNVTWLDEELRKDRAILSELRDLVDKQQVTLIDQAQRIMQLEDTVAKLRAQLLRISEVEQALQHTRDEVGIMLAEMREAQQKREVDFLRNRQAEREADVRAISEIRAQLERFGPLEQGLAVRQAEEQRLNEAVLRLGQELEVLSGRVREEEDVRRQLRDGIQKNEVEIKKTVEATAELRQDVQALTNRLLSLEDGLPRLAAQIAELQGVRQELIERQEEMLENQRRAERARAQQMTEWGRRLEGYAHQLETWADQLRYFADQHEKNRRVLRDTQTLAQDLSQKQDQLRQLQLLAEDQLRRELREFQRENEQRWAVERQRRDQQVSSQSEREDAQENRLLHLEEKQETLVDMLEALRQRLEAVHAEARADADKIVRVQRETWDALAEAFNGIINQLHATIDQDKKG
ncbi:MAG: hypothetical protein H5T69_05535 [Chloroflexi bacterium]|nr:hypothetical protein [Chloroflexota bacterium]